MMEEAPKQATNLVRGSILPPICFGMLLEDEAWLEEVDGQLDTEEKVVGKKGDD